MRKKCFALLRVSELPQIDEFSFRPLTDHTEVLTDHIEILKYPNRQEVIYIQ